ncbi:MipA/OmpV family protein [Aliamphritea hakodatensis]|uniref:MipA/OmpV family protein n=1 Tax=Aliamphritea hakodatensis TaxID=2895352 RepID=UPI0022FD5107|nr:MipA/OmpV family protein [Aliamphritea hakodatensis]
MRKTMLLLPLLGVAAAGVQAEENESSFALGIGVASEDSIYKGVGTETEALPFFSYENGSFYIQGPEAGYYIIDNDDFKIGALARYRTDGYKASDSSDLKGMDERKGAFELGITASYDTDYGEWSATFAADASSEHEGNEIELGWEKSFPVSAKWSVTPEASVSYRSDDLNNYYYGVKASEATVNRAAYTADADTVYEIGISAMYQIDQQQMIRVGASYTSYGDEIADSSIVEDDKSTSVSLLYMYRF